MKYLTLIFSIFINSLCVAQIPSNGLIAYYPFNGNVSDLSGNNYNGIVKGATLTTDRFGNPNSAYAFDGSKSYIEISNLKSTEFNENFTISTWVSFTNFINTYPYILQGENNYLSFAGTGEGYGSSFGNRIGFYTTFGNNPSDQQPYGNTDVSSNQIFPTEDKLQSNLFYHLLIIKKSDSISYYLNGQLSKQVEYINKPIISGGKIFLGRGFVNLNSTDYTLNGKLDDIRIYNRVLLPNEISDLFNEGKCFEKVTVTDTLKIQTITGINKIPSDFGILKIYPNPTKDMLNVMLNNNNVNTSYSIKILNPSGVSVYSMNMTSNNLTQINLNNFMVKGLYLIQILDNRNIVLETKKLLLE